MPLIDNLTKLQQPAKAKTPVWDGPDGVTQNSGITQGLIYRWLQCRERCRVYLVEGLKPVDTFNARLEYGTMFHLCCEAEAQGWAGEGNLQVLTEYAQDLCRRYPMQQGEVAKWYDVCRIQFPLYQEYWAAHPDTVERVPLLQEHEFSVPYKLPSGRVVRLRGKWDGVDLVGKDNPGLYLFESKTKSDIDEVAIKRQLGFDLQTMLYVVALEHVSETPPTYAPENQWAASIRHNRGNIRGVRYNVIRRPLSGGKGTIVQKVAKPPAVCPACKGTRRTPKGQKACGKCKGGGWVPGVPGETTEQYHARLAQYIRDEPHTYFMRWTVGITPQDIERFRRQALDPILEQLCDWWEFINYQKDPFEPTPLLEDGNRRLGLPYSLHWRTPYNAGSEFYSPDIDAYIENGMTAGLERVDNLFPELGGD